MWIKNYTLTIVVITLFTTIIEALMPSSNMKKHISLVIGVIMILAIAKPLISLPEHLIKNMELRLEYDAERNREDLTDRISRTQDNLIDKDFNEKLINKLKTDVVSRFGDDYEVEIGSYTKQEIVVVIHGEADENIASYIRNNYGITCTFE